MSDNEEVKEPKKINKNAFGGVKIALLPIKLETLKKIAKKYIKKPVKFRLSVNIDNKVSIDIIVVLFTYKYNKIISYL